MLRADFSPPDNFQQDAYAPRVMINDEAGQWVLQNAAQMYRSSFGSVGFPHDDVILEVGVQPEGRYHDLNARIKSLEITVAEQHRLLLACLSKLNDVAESLSSPLGVHSTSISSITTESSEIALRYSILAILEEDEDEVGARVPEFSAAGFGSSETEAISELKSELGTLYTELIDTPDELLGALPKAWKQALSNLILRDAR